MYGVESRVFYSAHMGNMGRIEMPVAKSRQSKARLGESRYCRKNGVRAACQMVTTLPRVGLGWVLNRPQVIAHRNHGEQDDDERQEGNDRKTALRTRTILNPHPQAHNGNSHYDPCEIEE